MDAQDTRGLDHGKKLATTLALSALRKGATMNPQTQRLNEGAKNYALADKSDPFAYNRAMTHVNNGISTVNGEAYYQAEPYKEERTLVKTDGSKENYFVDAYKNIKRP